jgi:hypothetical protein
MSSAFTATRLASAWAAAALSRGAASIRTIAAAKMQPKITNIVDFKINFTLMALPFYEFCTFRIWSVIFGPAASHSFTDTNHAGTARVGVDL